MYKDEVVLVTGSTQGIGKATSLSFYNAGAKVVFTGRRKEKLLSIEKELIDPSRAIFICIDFLKKRSCEELVDRVNKVWGRIDILINNCGGLREKGPFLDLDEKAWTHAFELNLLTAVTMSKLIIPIMKKNGGGRIVNLSSITALQPGSFNPHYSAIKFALINLTKHLSLQFANDNILVNSVSPGRIHTEAVDDYIIEKSLIENRDFSEIYEEEKERVNSTVPLKRFGTSEEVAELIKYICSDAGRYFTGSNFLIDGGKLKSVHL
tara:strand:+ start:3223 stop:4017 length:795 start_codon:yes stop_codon:yes gene_type:complete